MSYRAERWSWIHFVCGFLLAGFIVFLDVESDLVVHLLKCLVAASVFGVLSGRFGDSAWHALARAFRPFP